MKSPNGYVFHSRFNKDDDFFIRYYARDMHAALTELTQMCLALSSAEIELELHPTIRKAIDALTKANGWNIQ